MIYDPICMKLVQHLAPIWPYLVWYKSEISAIFGFSLPIFGAPAVIISLLLAIPSCFSEVSPQLIRTIRLTENSIPISSTQSKLNLICILLLTTMMTYKKKVSWMTVDKCQPLPHCSPPLVTQSLEQSDIDRRFLSIFCQSFINKYV